MCNRSTLSNTHYLPSGYLPSIVTQCPTDAQEIAHMCKVPYREAIGSLMYLAVTTCPDIAFAITTLSQYLNNLGVSHWEGVKRILRYVCGTTTVKLTYGVEQHN